MNLRDFVAFFVVADGNNDSSCFGARLNTAGGHTETLLQKVLNQSHGRVTAPCGGPDVLILPMPHVSSSCPHLLPPPSASSLCPSVSPSNPVQGRLGRRGLA